MQDRKKHNYRFWANGTLICVAAGFLASYPFRGTFWGGLAFSACSAGMVAGLADWFAVTALFRKPLGIRPGKIIRTEIIPRNRERIFSALSDMVEKDLLSKEAIKRQLEEYNSAAFLANYFSQPDIQAEVSVLLGNLLKLLLTDKEVTPKNIARLFQRGAELLDLSPLFAQLLESSRQQGYLDKTGAFLIQELRGIFVSRELREALSSWLEQAYSTYAQDSPARRLVSSFLPAPQDLAVNIQEKLQAWLEDLVVPDVISKWSENNWTPLLGIAATIFSNMHPEELLLEEIRANFSNPDKLTGLIRYQISNLLSAFSSREDWKIELDHLLKTGLLRFIDAHHAVIGQMVRSSLESLTNSKLVELIEQKAGNDLQMIRINGSVVGSMAGILFYLLNIALK